MTKLIKQTITTTDEFEQVAVRQLSLTFSFLKSHSTFSLALVYLFTSALGLLNIILLSSNFNIDILPHLEISDFILAPIHYPLIFIFLIFMSIATWFAFIIERKLRKFKRIEAGYNKINKPFFRFNPLLTYSLPALVLAMSAVDFSAENTHKDILKMKTQHYSLTLAEQVNLLGESVLHLPEIQVIADTVKYLWVYNNADQKIYAIPQKNVASLMPMAKKS